MISLSKDRVLRKLSAVLDPELRRSIVDLGMVQDVSILGGKLVVTVLLTVAHCPLRNIILSDVRRCLDDCFPDVESEVVLGVMSVDQRKALVGRLRGGGSSYSGVKIYAVVSGKGGVGKSTVTASLAVALSGLGRRVGVIDADVYGFSIPKMLGIVQDPTVVDRMIIAPSGHGVQAISTGMFTKGNEPVMWRGPLLHRALEQFIKDVYFDDLDILLLDLPPGTGDIAISLSQLLPEAELIVVTTPQSTASEVAQRAGAMAVKTGQKVFGVVENMSWFSVAGGGRINVFGSGGGDMLVDSLTDICGGVVRLLGRVPLELEIGLGGESGVPLVLSDPQAESSEVFRDIARQMF